MGKPLRNQPLQKPRWRWILEDQLCGQEVDKMDPVSCPVAGFGISYAESSSSIIKELFRKVNQWKLPHKAEFYGYICLSQDSVHICGC
jgi:hypothetical protein